jgi:pimeloyl-ACP methyl ester carboxylesterase
MTKWSSAASVNGATLDYEVTGSGPGIVLIGGGGSLDHRIWARQAAAFSQHHRVLSYDVRGIGGSSRPDAMFSHGDDLSALVQSIGMTEGCLIGLSFGAGIAVDCALDHPQVVRALVLVAPGLSSDKDENLKAALAAAAVARTTGIVPIIESIVTNPAMLARPSADVQEHVKSIYLDNADVFASDFALVRLWRPTDPPADRRLGAIDVPTLILVGDQDTLPARASAERVAAGILTARLTVIERAGHLLNVDAPDQFNEAVLDFLGSI